MVKKLKYGGRNVKIVENIDFWLILTISRGHRSKTAHRKILSLTFFDTYMRSQHIDILLLQFSGNFQKNNTG